VTQFRAAASDTVPSCGKTRLGQKNGLKDVMRSRMLCSLLPMRHAVLERPMRRHEASGGTAVSLLLAVSTQCRAETVGLGGGGSQPPCLDRKQVFPHEMIVITWRAVIY
jgi:hypothetical protein